MELDSLAAPPRRPRRIGRWILLALLVAGAGYYGWRRSAHTAITDGAAAEPKRSLPVRRVVPESVRVRVEVLNATDTRGLARQAMFALRDAGFDVVSFGTTSERQDSTLVLDRSGHPEWAALAVKALGEARAESRPDSSRYLDLTILIGKRWALPSEPFHP